MNNIDNEAIAAQREKGLRNWNTWCSHKQPVDLALERYFQKPCAQTEDHLYMALLNYRRGYERGNFCPPTGSLYKADNAPPEMYQFRNLQG